MPKNNPEYFKKEILSIQNNNYHVLIARQLLNIATYFPHKRFENFYQSPQNADSKAKIAHSNITLHSINYINSSILVKKASVNWCFVNKDINLLTLFSLKKKYFTFTFAFLIN
jgi:hypothetical protein